MTLIVTNKQQTIIGIALCLLVPLAAILLNMFFVPNFFLGGYFSRGLMWLSVGIVFWYSTTIEQQPFLPWQETKRTIWHYLLAIITIYFAISICAVIINAVLSLAGIHQQSARLKDMVLYMRAHRVLLIFTCLTAGIMEELLFRGYLMPRLEAITGSKVWSIIISALMFGGLHFGYGTITNILGPVIIGLLFAIYYQQYRNLKVLMICHFLIDFMAITFMKLH